MAIYLGRDKVKINLDGVTYYLNFFSATPVVDIVQLLSSDNYILQDENGLYLTAKEREWHGN